jgi:RimJ/RimL family protein N-acetyltransferase
MFTPLVTERLLLRPVRQNDAQPLFERRNDPDVAVLQDWTTPYPRERASALIQAAMATPSPVSDDWWMLTIADRDDTVVYGDVALHLENDGRTAEVGYTLAKEHWGHSFATEALSGLLDWLFDVQGVSRATGMLHPDNLRSARVLERCGFVYEGHTRNSFWLGDENSDDWIYGLTPELRAEWDDRPRTPPASIELVEPYPTGLRDVMKLVTHKSQERFVAPIVWSLAQVAVPPLEKGAPLVPWPRIVHADGEAVGFVMLSQPTPTDPEPYLWRLLIDRRHQQRGIGRRVVELVIEEAKLWGGKTLLVSWMPGIGSPEPLYLSMGFEPTGEMDEDEIVARLVL